MFVLKKILSKLSKKSLKFVMKCNIMVIVIKQILPMGG